VKSGLGGGAQHFAISFPFRNGPSQAWVLTSTSTPIPRLGTTLGRRSQGTLTFEENRGQILVKEADIGTWAATRGYIYICELHLA